MYKYIHTNVYEFQIYLYVSVHQQVGAVNMPSHKHTLTHTHTHIYKLVQIFMDIYM